MAHPEERTTRTNAPDVRGDLASQDAQRTTETGVISDEEFDRLLNSEFDQTALPRPPEMPGWHLCWLSTTSAYDTIQKRERLGYQAVRRSDMPGFDPSRGKELVGHEGFVTCNEMILFRIREERYQQMMLHFHHKLPLQEEAGIVSRLKSNNEQDSAGRSLASAEGDGINDMEESVRRGERATPTFASS